jgi:ABC-type nitrate/sulfonate/bicarbonate transport system substrate-binding protein
MAAGPTAMSALLGGSIDYLVCSGNAFARAASIGQPLVAILALSRGTGGSLLAPKKYESRGVGLTALKQWDGATWGMASAGGIAEFHARRAAEDAGLDWKKQNIVYTGSLNASAAGVLSGRLDIGELDYWSAAMLVGKGDAYVVVNLSKDLTNDRPYSEQLDWVLVARKDTVEKYPALTQAIVEAELRGLRKVQFLKGNPSGALAIYPHSKTGPLPAKPFATYWSLNEPGVDEVTGFITPEAIEATDTVMRQMNVFKDGQKTPASAYTNRFVQAAYAALKLSQPK